MGAARARPHHRARQGADRDARLCDPEHRRDVCPCRAVVRQARHAATDARGAAWPVDALADARGARFGTPAGEGPAATGRAGRQSHAAPDGQSLLRRHQPSAGRVRRGHAPAPGGTRALRPFAAGDLLGADGRRPARHHADLSLVVADVPRPRVGCAQQQPARDQRGARHGACVHPGACARRRVLRDDEYRAAAGRACSGSTTCARCWPTTASPTTTRWRRCCAAGAWRRSGSSSTRAGCWTAGCWRIGPPRRGSTCRASCASPPRPMAGRGGSPPRSN